MDDVAAIVALAGHQAEPLAGVLVLAELLLEGLLLLGLLGGGLSLVSQERIAGTGCKSKRGKWKYK